LFLGHHTTQLKKSNQLPIPSNWQELISSGVYLTQGFDQNILILMPTTFQEIYSQVTALNIADPLARMLQRMFLSTASFVESAGNETISLPQELLGYAKLESDVVVVGQGEYVEVWSSDLWQQQQIEIQDSQANAQRFSAFAISTAENHNNA
jgi:MraZ protein